MSGSSPSGRKSRFTQLNTVLLKETEKCNFSGNTKEMLRGKQLWLIRVPNELDARQLNGLTMSLNTTTDIITSDEVELQSSATPYDQQDSSVSFIPMGVKPGRVKLGPPLVGQVSIVKTVAVPEVELPAPVSKCIEVPAGLKQRWQPFGWNKPASSRKRRPTDPIMKVKKTKKRKGEN